MTEIRSDLAASVWKVLKAPGDAVAAEEPVLILESMKMEIPVVAPHAGKVRAILVAEGETVAEEQVLAAMEP